MLKPIAQAVLFDGTKEQHTMHSKVMFHILNLQRSIESFLKVRHFTTSVNAAIFLTYIVKFAKMRRPLLFLLVLSAYIFLVLVKYLMDANVNNELFLFMSYILDVMFLT